MLKNYRSNPHPEYFYALNRISLSLRLQFIEKSRKSSNVRHIRYYCRTKISNFLLITYTAIYDKEAKRE